MEKVVGSGKSKRDDSDSPATGMVESKRHHPSETSVVPMVSELATCPCVQAEDTVMLDLCESDEELKNGSGAQLLDSWSIARAVSMIVFGSLRGFTDMLATALKGNDVASNAFLTIFKGLAKFVVNVFELEVFEQILHHEELEKQRAAMFNEFKELRDLRDVVDAFVKGKINMDKYDRLWEADIGILLEDFVDNVPESYGIPMYCTQLSLGSSSEIEALDSLRAAHDAVMERVSLEAEERMHLIMEVVQITGVNNINCWGLVDALALDAIREMNFECQLKDFIVDDFARFVAILLRDLRDWKADLVVAFSRLVRRPLSCGCFGSFSIDVVKLVGVADFRRRCEDQRFISLHHILWALHHTSIAGDVQKRVLRFVDELELKPLCEPAKHPPYDIYLSSRMLANRCGAEIVGMEHFVLASVCLRTESNLGAQGFDDSMWNVFLKVPSIYTFLADVQTLKYNEGGKSSGSGNGSSRSGGGSEGSGRSRTGDGIEGCGSSINGGGSEGSGSDDLESEGSEISGSKGYETSESEGGSSSDGCMAKSWAPPGVSFFELDGSQVSAVARKLKDLGWSLRNGVMTT